MDVEKIFLPLLMIEDRFSVKGFDKKVSFPFISLIEGFGVGIKKIRKGFDYWIIGGMFDETCQVLKT